MSGPESLTQSQLDAISVIERVCSVFSLLGSIFVILTFIMSKAFHKPINRLVFYASFGNMMTNVGTLMSKQYLSQPNSVGCQFQAFLIQWFMPADAFWTLSMAINVYLTFYFKFDAQQLRRMEVPYLVACYGIPFIPALTYIFIRNGDGVRVYGNATLWCWVSLEWDIWRIITFYGPVWVVVAATFFIYIRAGHTIYCKRKELGKFSSTDQDLASLDDALASVKTTEVSVTTEVMNSSNAIRLQPMGGRQPPDVNSPRNDNGAYSVHISADTSCCDNTDVVLPVQNQLTHSTSHGPGQRSEGGGRGDLVRRTNHDINNAAWQYTKCAILFFTVLLVTWIPSSANRVYTILHTKASSITLEFMSAFVLPLQGFWNAIIYIVTTWRATKNLVSDLKMGRRPDTAEYVGGMAPEPHHHENPPHSQYQHILGQFRTERRSNKAYETESMTELANSRRESQEGGQGQV
ncbi:hypothetical protein FOQG_18722 [Fusarium oxysporum f. sp. raphani 54005]|uniref:G-protein coupled receptors family 2 profile 2 domain-containing protein n=1 Tax=Fusarium oxysporum f. sp. raphani 54005 TaxID=1089458 RepID=X0C169_FUSOX|nr:hypothetical protein FOQG_18722 [Fusarium oxysporum f. sp. raphani 54005]